MENLLIAKRNLILSRLLKSLDEPNGTVEYPEFEKIYNKKWAEFLFDADNNSLNRSRKEILDFALDLVKKYGIEE